MITTIIIVAAIILTLALFAAWTLGRVSANAEQLSELLAHKQAKQ